MEILMVRHGQTEANVHNWYYGFTDSPMTALGEEQARTAGVFINKLKFEPDKIFISERHRTRDTLTLMNFPLAAAQVDGRINEQHMGQFECMAYEDIKAKYPQAFDDWNKDFNNYAPPGGESHASLYNRVKDFLEELIDKYGQTEEKIFIVTHGGVMHSTYAYLNGDHLESYYSVVFNNCSMMRMKYMKDRLVLNALVSPEEIIRLCEA